MAKLIDADVLKQDINKVSTHWLCEWSTLGVLVMVDKQPTVDAVPVVRCRECKHYEPFRERDGFCKIDGMLNSEAHYCSYGERKGGDE